MQTIINFAAAHGNTAVVNADGKSVTIFISTYSRHTGERGRISEVVSTMDEARDALGY